MERWWIVSNFVDVVISMRAGIQAVRELFVPDVRGELPLVDDVVHHGLCVRGAIVGVPGKVFVSVDLGDGRTQPGWVDGVVEFLLLDSGHEGEEHLSQVCGKWDAVGGGQKLVVSSTGEYEERQEGSTLILGCQLVAPRWKVVRRDDVFGLRGLEGVVESDHRGWLTVVPTFGDGFVSYEEAVGAARLEAVLVGV